MNECYFNITKANKSIIEGLRKDVAFAKKVCKGFIWTWEDTEVFTIHTNDEKFISYLMQFRKA